MTKHDLLTRRRAIASIGAAAGTMLLPRVNGAASVGAATEIARGRVVEAGRKSSRWLDRRGISGVMVSNGRDVVLTDADGRWSLPVRSGDHVFVVVPSQWSTRTRDAAAFAYLHQPGGTPSACGLTGPSVEPTGPLPASIDFVLERQAQSNSFDVLLFADTQAADARELGYVRHVLLEATKNSNATFAIHHGDAMGDDLTLFPEYLRILEETGIAWHHCPGNHDINLDSADARTAFEAWKRYIGPTNYAFQYGGATFILLNNVDYFGRGKTGPDGRGYRGMIGEEQLAFVTNILRNVPADDLVVVSMHVPLASFDNPDNPADTTGDAAALLKLLSCRPNTVSFSGHSHTTEHHFLGPAAGFSGAEPHHHQVLTAACGSWWSGPFDANGIPVADSRDGTPKGFHVLSVNGREYTTRFAPFDNIASREMRVLTHLHEGKTNLIVDVFDGGPNTSVTCEIDGLPETAIRLERSAIADPYIVEAYEGYRGNCKPWVAPARSSHVWTAELPQAFGESSRELVIRATDERFAPIESRSFVS